MAGLEQLHQRKRDDETDRGPFQASQKHIKHPSPDCSAADRPTQGHVSGLRVNFASDKGSSRSQAFADIGSLLEMR